MANEKVFQSRIQLKHDVEENWSKATNFIPKVGEIIIYDIDENNSIARFKIGDGTTNVNLLPFVSHHEVISYLPQELTEDQQMQARANLGLYCTTEEPEAFLKMEDYAKETPYDITRYNVYIGPISDYNSTLEFNIEFSGFKKGEGDISENGIYHGTSVIEANNLDVDAWGNLSLLSNDSTISTELPDNLENTGGRFCFYKKSVIENGNWISTLNIIADGYYVVAYMTVASTQNTMWVKHPVPEEYIPNTIARISDIPQNIVQYTEQTLSEEEQMQARANLGLYHSKETLLETGELAFNENKIADICFGGINNTSCDGKYCKLVLKKDNISIECYGTVEARIFSQAFLLLVNCSFTGKYDGQNFTASYECVEGSGGLTITEIYSSVESSFVSSTWNYELYSVEQNFIPEEYIPESIARVADVETSLATKLTIPETASVGQLIKVSVVDGTGKVIATEGQDVAYEDEALDLLYEMKVIDPIAAEDGKILTLESGEILLL